MSTAKTPDLGEPEGRAETHRRESSLPDLTLTFDLARGALAGDSVALDQLLGRYKDRLRRLVTIRVNVRLRCVLEQEGLPREILAEARHDVSASELRSHAQILEWLARIVERQIATPVDASCVRRTEQQRRLRITHSPEVTGESPDVAAARVSQRHEFERLVDAHVERLEPSEYREVLLLRDYFGGDWEFVRERLGLLSVDAVQELYRRAHASLQRRVRPHLGRRG
jgi:hypothetical protein